MTEGIKDACWWNKVKEDTPMHLGVYFSPILSYDGNGIIENISNGSKVLNGPTGLKIIVLSLSLNLKMVGPMHSFAW